jgi:hypothetical protein
MHRLHDFTYHGVSLVREVFIETGTYMGETLMAAVQAGFPELHSIELSWERYLRAESIFSVYPQVHLHQGSSPDVLARIIDPTKPTLFWLDAHFQGESDTPLGDQYGQCPLLAELLVIRAMEWSEPLVILIDDAGMFQSRPGGVFVAEEWPTVEEIEASLPGFRTEIEEGVIYCFGEAGA